MQGELKKSNKEISLRKVSLTSKVSVGKQLTVSISTIFPHTIRLSFY